LGQATRESRLFLWEHFIDVKKMGVNPRHKIKRIIGHWQTVCKPLANSSPVIGK
jgi:hypothetical protein